MCEECSSEEVFYREVNTALCKGCYMDRMARRTENIDEMTKS